MNGQPLWFKEEVVIVLGGEAGKGIQTIETIVGKVLRASGYHVFSTNEFMSRIRGGSNSTQIRVASHPVAAYLKHIDILVALDNKVIDHLGKRISSTTLILGEKSIIGDAENIFNVPLFTTALELGNKIYENIVASGMLLCLLGVDVEIINSFLKRLFSEKKQDVIDNNIEASLRGYALGKDILESGILQISIPKSQSAITSLFCTGSDAVGLGALAAGCNFVAAYPMSPSTNVLNFLAKHQTEFGIIVEQAEDEIAAINMAIGAWYAGARGFVTTAGGGFALMCEGVSLAGMLETPVVVHVGQRPSPATGLPTRTEQSDLELVLYAGQGEFPRIVYAPGTLEDAFSVLRRAFDGADKFQVPVFVLTDQFILDSYASMNPVVLSDFKHEAHIVQTQADYKRYAYAENGISPRGVPGFGEGIVCVDSDEHTEEGYITEDADVRRRMMDKRMKKLAAIKADVLEPRFEGPPDYTAIVVCWGSNYHPVKEALATINRSDVALLHFTQVYPLHEKTMQYIANATKTIIVENNATAQLNKLIKQTFGIACTKTILQYNGAPFAVEDLVDMLKEHING